MENIYIFLLWWQEVKYAETKSKRDMNVEIQFQAYDRCQSVWHFSCIECVLSPTLSNKGQKRVE